ncbi:MAG: hypothetical protein JOS17DRAFT_243930 [Linnemannia elongata]|nr:MAG: hypothetical protein JOS17DRAFT_243930 [Linnemannia elongata]
MPPTQLYTIFAAVIFFFFSRFFFTSFQSYVVSTKQTLALFSFVSLSSSCSSFFFFFFFFFFAVFSFLFFFSLRNYCTQNTHLDVHILSVVPFCSHSFICSLLACRSLSGLSVSMARLSGEIRLQEKFIRW